MNPFFPNKPKSPRRLAAKPSAVALSHLQLNCSGSARVETEAPLASSNGCVFFILTVACLVVSKLILCLWDHLVRQVNLVLI